VDVDFVGHPLLDAIAKKSTSSSGLPVKPYIAILPGSRKQEISRMLPVMLSLKKEFPDYPFVIAGVSSHPLSYYKTLMKDSDDQLVFGRTYDILANAYAAVVTSGTATLETALFRVPQVVCYKGSGVSYFIARRLIKISVKYISLVNLILDKAVVKELIQSKMNRANILSELKSLLEDQEKRKSMIHEYDELVKVLGGAGASERTAGHIAERMKEI
jgi:lipid-A-disaccharide synthase